MDGSDVRSDCAACGKPVSYTDEGGCVGTLPNAYHFRAACLLEALRREGAENERLREAGDELVAVTRRYLHREAHTGEVLGAMRSLSDITALPPEARESA